MGVLESQRAFTSIYRGRQSNLHHMSYMRMGKVLLALRLLKEADIDLEGSKIFDYGFGAGTFFRYCPLSAKLYGVELDDKHIARVQAFHAGRHAHVDLRPISITDWQEHPLLKKTYDVVFCSHVLEHLEEPSYFLSRIKRCLGSKGVFAGLVPINERANNPHHLHSVDRHRVKGWAKKSDMNLEYYIEDDPWLYWIHGLFTADEGWRHTFAQAISLGLGIPATMLGPKTWHVLSGLFARITRSKPTQAAFILTP